MKVNIIRKIGWKRLLPVTVSLAVILVMSAVFAHDWKRLNLRNQDMPPVIEFTWTPLGTVDLREFRGFLKMTDDYSLDFRTYRLEVVEAERVFDMPIEGMIGREYETPISLGLLAENPNIAGKEQVTLKFSISDDRGQSAELERVVRIKPTPVVTDVWFE